MAQVLSFFLDFISFAVGDWVFGAIIRIWFPGFFFAPIGMDCK